ncbi:hypothetical protein DYB32_008118 [Aphanomyces invadans]|uniref:Major facilitator superfamily associated domain-containing protein n=1 Tax=Aphanomyces invadans TaxID=157072 RepID=A0A3R6VSJ9_9STRA|nr:hypothetical protein DYB32_008118 [Aphanomyces invadans]
MTLVNYTAVREAVDGTDMAYFKQVKALSLMQCIWSTDFFFLYVAFAASIIPAMVFSSELVELTTVVFHQTVEATNTARVQGLSTFVCMASLTAFRVVVIFAGQLVIPVMSDLIIRIFYANPASARKIMFFAVLSAQLGSMVALSNDHMTFESVKALAFTFVFCSGGSMALIQCFITDMFGVYHAGTMYGLIVTCWSLRAAIVGYGFADFHVSRESFLSQMQWMLVVVAIGWVALLLVRTNSIDRFFDGYKYSICGKVVVQFSFARRTPHGKPHVDSDSVTVVAPSSGDWNGYTIWDGYDELRTSQAHQHAAQHAL